jgi:hypothetical protein
VAGPRRPPPPAAAGRRRPLLHTALRAGERRAWRSPWRRAVALRSLSARLPLAAHAGTVGPPLGRHAATAHWHPRRVAVPLVPSAASCSSRAGGALLSYCSCAAVEAPALRAAARAACPALPPSAGTATACQRGEVVVARPGDRRGSSLESEELAGRRGRARRELEEAHSAAIGAAQAALGEARLDLKREVEHGPRSIAGPTARSSWPAPVRCAAAMDVVALDVAGGLQQSCNKAEAARRGAARRRAAGTRVASSSTRWPETRARRQRLAKVKRAG